MARIGWPGRAGAFQRVMLRFASDPGAARPGGFGLAGSELWGELPFSCGVFWSAPFDPGCPCPASLVGIGMPGICAPAGAISFFMVSDMQGSPGATQRLTILSNSAASTWP